MACTKETTLGAQTGSDSFNTMKSTIPPLLAQPAAAVVVDESLTCCCPYTIINSQPGPDGLSWTSKHSLSTDLLFVIEAIHASPCPIHIRVAVSYARHTILIEGIMS